MAQLGEHAALDLGGHEFEPTLVIEITEKNKNKNLKKL